ncbi:flavocytochrome c [Eggerthellaceae bacterium zg-997]|nr:flavocytochrome c [Eggerthellaceae bacterium zg-997]
MAKIESIEGTAPLSRRTFLSGAVALGAAAATFALAGCAPRSMAQERADSVIDGGGYDIVVVGAGGAGMAAAIGAHDQGARVLLLEKMPVAGGNTCFAEGGMNACETRFQAAAGIEDSVELFAADTFKGGHRKGNRELIDHMCRNSNDAVEWLAGMGIVLSKLSTSGGASVKRIHRPESGEAVGKYIVKGLAEQCRQRGISAVCNTKVEQVLMDGERVAGVRATDSHGMTVEYRAQAVIVTTGGFGANHEMLAGYRPELLNAVTTNQPGSQGDGIAFCQAIGADTVDMDQIQVHPTVEQTTATLLSEGIRGDGAILVNAEGVRFTNELLTRDVVSANEWKQTGGGAWAVFDRHVRESNKSIEEKFEKRRIIQVANTYAELAEKMGVSTDAFVSTMEGYNAAIDAGEDDPLGRTKARNPIVLPPFYAVAVAPGIHHCMGGLRVNADAQVLNAAGDPIPGLFAAGEVTGGLHGGNRLGGNAVCDISVNGIQAQKTACSYVFAS